MAIGADDLSSAVGIFDWLKILAAPGIAVAFVGAAFHFGGRVGAVENSLKSNDEKTAGLSLRLTANEVKTEAGLTALQLKAETLTRDHTNLAVAVAALPTRSEMAANFESLSREVRAAKSVA
jgi:hypothetical protein